MRRLTVVALAIALSAALFPAGAASADHFPHTRCSPSGDSCVSVKKLDGVRRLRLGLLFRYFPRHDVCVKGPADELTCHTYRTRRLPGGIWGSTIDWRANYPFEGDGRYRVSWRVDGGTVGTLKFHVG